MQRCRMHLLRCARWVSNHLQTCLKLTFSVLKIYVLLCNLQVAIAQLSTIKLVITCKGIIFRNNQLPYRPSRFHSCTHFLDTSCAHVSRGLALDTSGNVAVAEYRHNLKKFLLLIVFSKFRKKKFKCMEMTQSGTNSLEEAAKKRKERLKNLKRKKESDTTANEDKLQLPK